MAVAQIQPAAGILISDVINEVCLCNQEVQMAVIKV